MKCSNSLLESRLKQKDKNKQEEKAQAWAKIKQEEPLLDELMTKLSQALGKPKAVRVELKNEVILNVGEFDKPKNYFDGKLRRASQK